MDEELVVVEVDRVHAVHGGGTRNQKCVREQLICKPGLYRVSLNPCQIN